MRFYWRRLLDTILVLLLAPLLEKLWAKFAFRLGEHAVLGWLDDVIAALLGVSAPSAAAAAALIWEWGPPIAAAFGGLLLYHLMQKWLAEHSATRRSTTKGIRMSVLLIGMIVCGLGFLVFATLYFVANKPKTKTPIAEVPAVEIPRAVLAPSHPAAAPSRSAQPPSEAPIPPPPQDAPLKWNFNDIEQIFGFNEAHDGSLLVGVFRILGYNQSPEPITNVNAYVIPQITEKRLQLRFNTRDGLLDTKDTHIPAGPGTEVPLVYFLPPSDNRHQQGLFVTEYLDKYGGFEFVFEWAGGKFSHKISYNQVKEMLTQRQAQWDAQRKRLPEIRRRPE